MLRNITLKRLALVPVLGGALLAAPPAQARASIDWEPCPPSNPGIRGLECGTIRVPLDYSRPDGARITLALSRARHTSTDFQGVVLLNRGGPGADGRDMPKQFTESLPEDVASAYDWIGFDPRGVGASTPALSCEKRYQDPGRPRPDTVPASAEDERAWLLRAKAYADDCAARHGDMLPHMGTENWARDMETIRSALGQDRINYFGYSYGTYLGAVYASMYPGRVRRMVLDSVVRPSGVWYENNLDQNVAFEKRIRAYFRWIAARDKLYRLGKTEAAVRRSYYAARKALTAKPAGKRIGPSELDDLFLNDGYNSYTWPIHARALSEYQVKHKPGALLKLWKPPTRQDQNNYAVYNAVQCRDAAWPRSWRVWHRDHWRLYDAGNRFETWSNAWYNAPCLFWDAPSGPPTRVGGSPTLPGILLVQATEDAATPYPGAVEMHRRFQSSRLLVQDGGGDHGVSLGGDLCVDDRVAAYLDNGSLPADRPGPDAVCR